MSSEKRIDSNRRPNSPTKRSKVGKDLNRSSKPISDALKSNPLHEKNESEFHPIVQKAIDDALSREGNPASQAKLRQHFVDYQVDQNDNTNPLYNFKKISAALPGNENKVSSSNDLEGKFAELKTQNSLLEEKGALIEKISCLQRDINGLFALLHWNRKKRNFSENSSDLEMLLDQIATNPSFSNLEFPLLLPSEEEKRKRLDIVRQENELSSSLNQIVFLAIEKNLGSNPEASLVEYYIAFSCLKSTFKISFRSERQSSGKQKITTLSIKSEDHKDNDMLALISKCELSCELVGFFRLLPQFLSKKEKRDVLFIKIRKHFASYLEESLSDNICLLSPPRSSLFHLTLVYHLALSSQSNKIEESIELIPCQISKHLTNQQVSVIDQIPYNFKTLCDLKGPYQALDTIIKAVWG